MTWAKLDDSFDEHRKLLAVGPLGIALWVAGLGFCSRNLTDGFIPIGKVPGLVNWTLEYGGASFTVTLEAGADVRPVTSDFVASILVVENLWEEVDGGYQVHDYLDYNPSREEVLAKRAADRIRQKRSREGPAGGELVEKSVDNWAKGGLPGGELVDPLVEKSSRRDSQRNPRGPVPVNDLYTNRSASSLTLGSGTEASQRARIALDENLRVADLVAELVDKLKDPGSRRYLQQVARSVPESYVRATLSLVMDPRTKVRNRAAMFTSIMQRHARKGGKE